MKNTDIPSLSNVSNAEITTDASICPSCLMEREATDLECRSCGIVFAQYYKWSKEKRTKLTISGLYHLNVAEIETLEKLRKNVELAYWDQQAHEKLLHACLRLRSLPFAAHFYTERLTIFPDDDIAYLQLTKVSALAKDWFGTSGSEDIQPLSPRLWRYTAALSVIGMIAGVFTLFLGLLTKSVGFYSVFAIVTIATSVGLFGFAKKSAQ